MNKKGDRKSPVPQVSYLWSLSKSTQMSSDIWETKKDSPGHPWDYPLKLGTKKGKATPTALEATLPVIFYPVDFVV